MFKIHLGFSKVSCLNLFHNCDENNFYSLRSQPDFQIPRTNTTSKGTESVRYFGAVIFQLKIFKILTHLKQREITKSKLRNCSCRLYETYVKDLELTLVNNNAC